MATPHSLPTGNPWSTLAPVLAPETLEVVEEEFKFTHLTAVQSATIPAFLSNKDVLVQAVTGSGKTLAFVIPTIEILTSLPTPLQKHHIGAVILTPTRELAQQIHTIVSKFVERVPLAVTAGTPRPEYLTKPALCIGGKNQDKELQQMKAHGANILIGTPGRLDQILSQQLIFDPSTIEMLILDEADRLLEAGFQVNITSIIKKVPKQRRTGLFSATLTQQIEQLTKVGLRNPVKITLKVQYKDTSGSLATKPAIEDKSVAKKNKNKGGDDDDSDMAQSGSDDDDDDMMNDLPPPPKHQAIPSTLTNYYHIVQPEHKMLHLISFLLQHLDENIIIFFLTCAEVDYFYRVLSTFPLLAAKYNVFNHEMVDTVGLSHMLNVGVEKKDDRALFCALHGQMNQSKRTRTYEAYKKSTLLNREQRVAYNQALAQSTNTTTTANTPQQQTTKKNKAQKTTTTTLKKPQGSILLCTDVAARGIDVDNIDWVLQVDAPQHPDAFIHRIGRCARAGQRGNALTWLLNSEQGFVELMREKNVPFVDYQTTFTQTQRDNLKTAESIWDGVCWNPVEENYYETEKPSATPAPTSASKKNKNNNKTTKKNKSGDDSDDDDSDNDADDSDDEAAEELVQLSTTPGAQAKITKQLTNITPLPSCLDAKAIIPYNTYKVLVVKKENRRGFKQETKKSDQVEQVAFKKQTEAMKKHQELNQQLPPFTKIVLKPPTIPPYPYGEESTTTTKDTAKLTAMYQAIAAFIAHCRYCVSYDKYLFEICQKSYVSHINAYKEHVAKFTFPFDQLLFVHVAIGYGMLFLPVLHDLKKYALIWPHLSRLPARDIQQYHNQQIGEIKTADLERKKAQQQKQIEKRKESDKEKRKEREFNDKQRAKKAKTRAKTTFDEMEKEWFELGDELREIKKQKKK